MNWTAENIWKNLIELYNQAYGTNYTVIVTPKEEVNEDDGREQRETAKA